VFDQCNSPEYKKGDLIIIDPTAHVVRNEMVLATIGAENVAAFGTYQQPRPYVESPLEMVRNPKAQAHIAAVTGEKFEALIAAAPSKEELTKLLWEMTESFFQKIYLDTELRYQNDIYLGYLNGEFDPISLAKIEYRIIGVMIEHIKPGRRRFGSSDDGAP
jgi:hypothetical protein